MRLFVPTAYLLLALALGCGQEGGPVGEGPLPSPPLTSEQRAQETLASPGVTSQPSGALPATAEGQDEGSPRPSPPALVPAVGEGPGGGSAQAPPGELAREETTRPKTVVLDPGHGGPDDVGAANYGVVEKHSNLEMALRVEALLKAQGLRVILTRRADSRSVLYPADGPLSGFGASRADLQARVDLVNAEKADLFISIHSNGSTDGNQKGVEVWYDPNRPFGDKNLRRAQLLLAHVLAELRAYDYRAVDRGLKDDTCFRVRDGRCFPLFVLGPERETRREEVLRRGGNPEQLGFAPGQEVITTRATQMPGALVELLIISNEADAAVLRDEGGRDAMASGIARAVMEFFAEDDGS